MKSLGILIDQMNSCSIHLEAEKFVHYYSRLIKDLYKTSEIINQPQAVYGIVFICRVLFPSKNRSDSTKETSSPALSNLNLLGSKVNIKRNIESCEGKPEYIQKSHPWRLVCGLSLGLGTMKNIHQKSN